MRVDALNPFRGIRGRGSNTIRAEFIVEIYERGSVSHENIDCSLRTFVRIKEELPVRQYGRVDKEIGRKAVVGTRNGVARWLSDELNFRDNTQKIANELLTTHWVDRIPDGEGYDFDHWHRAPKLLEAINEKPAHLQQGSIHEHLE